MIPGSCWWIYHLIVKWRLAYTVLMRQKLILLFTLAAACALAQSRVYELRTYHVYEGKLEALKANFRDHHIQTFKRHGIESIGYWVPEDPEFLKVAAESGKIVEKVESVYLDATDFSPLK